MFDKINRLLARKVQKSETGLESVDLKSPQAELDALQAKLELSVKQAEAEKEVNEITDRVNKENS